MSEWTKEQIQSKLADPSGRTVVVDVLEPGMHARAHIPGAVNLPESRIRELAATVLPDKDAEIITYCSGPL